MPNQDKPKNLASMDMSSEECDALLARYPFGTLFTLDGQVTQIPFMRNSEDIIELHLAKNNPQLNALDGGDCVLSVLGPHAFIAAHHYQSKPAVPTWNYATVAIRGTATLMSAELLHQSLDRLLQHFEPSLLENKSILPDAFRENLEKHIVGVQIQVESIKGKLKLGQHRSIADQTNVFTQLNTGNLDMQNYAQFAENWLREFRPNLFI